MRMSDVTLALLFTDSQRSELAARLAHHRAHPGNPS